MYVNKKASFWGGIDPFEKACFYLIRLFAKTKDHTFTR